MNSKEKKLCKTLESSNRNSHANICYDVTMHEFKTKQKT